MGTWDMILANWEFVLPPSRPNDIELRRIKQYVKSFSRKEPVSVLGSTIEFRDLLYSMGFEKVYVFEKNIAFHNTLNDWKVYPNTNEVLIEGDWIDTLPMYSGIFNFCLSDLTMGNIAYKSREKFYNSISNSLKEGGIFIDKVLTNEIPFIPLEDILKKYRNLAVNLKNINDFSCEALFCSELLNAEIINTTEFYSVLRDTFSNNLRLMKFIDKAHLITPENCVWYYGRPWDMLKFGYFSCFTRTEYFEDISSSPYYQRAKHFINSK